MAVSTLFVISGSTGSSGELLAHTVLAQFREVQAPIQIEAHVHEPEQAIAAVARVAVADGIIIHTMVNARCRQALNTAAQQMGCVPLI